MPPRHPALTYLAFVAGLLAAWYWCGGPARGPADDREAMLGTWTEEAGPPGNSIRFYYVPRELPRMPYARAYEGHASLVKQLGAEETAADWNYSSLDPLVLNVCADGRAWLVAVRKVDADHILIRFGTDWEEMSQADALDHPDTRRLTRTGP